MSMLTSTWAWRPPLGSVNQMSTFNANPLDQSIKLAYRAVPMDSFVDPVAEKLAMAAMGLAVVVWVIHAGIFAFRPMDWTTFLLVVSVCISIVAFMCVVGAMLERNIPWLAWLAMAWLVVYWLLLAWTAILRVLAPFGAGPPPPFPLS